MEKGEKLYQASLRAVEISQTVRQLLTDDEFKLLLQTPLTSFADLPARLTSFAIFSRAHVEVFGKTEYKRKDLFRRIWFARTAEFVRLSTGRWHYEHLGDLYREASGNDAVFGDLLRRRRERFEKECPIMYALAVKSAQDDYARYLHETFRDELSRGIAEGLARIGE